MTSAVVVLLADESGQAVAVAGDDEKIPPALRAILGARALREAGSVRELLSLVDLSGSLLNVTVQPVAATHLLAILFDSEVDLATVQRVAREACTLLAELLADDVPGAPNETARPDA